MGKKSITASNGIALTRGDLKKAIKIAKVNWTEAAYANNKAASTKPTDICLFDFFEDSWELVDDDFTNEYENCGENTSVALAHVIEHRASIWHDWSNQSKEEEVECYRCNGKPFSLAYAKLFIACDNKECDFQYCEEGVNIILSKVCSKFEYSGHSDAKKYVKYHHSFVWGNVEYSITKCYKDEHINRGNIDGQPDIISIKVKKAAA